MQSYCTTNEYNDGKKHNDVSNFRWFGHHITTKRDEEANALLPHIITNQNAMNSFTLNDIDHNHPVGK